MLLTFLIVSAVMGLMTWLKPLPAPRVLPVREEMAMETEPVVKIAGAAVVAVVAIFVVWFW